MMKNTESLIKIYNKFKSMVKILRFTAVFTMGLLFCATIHAAQNPEVADSSGVTSASDSLFPHSSRSLATSHFTWGAEAGASLDMTSHDLSTFDVDVLLGYKNSFLNLVGVGAGIHRSIHTGNNFIPVYAVIRTDFRKKPSPLFMNIQAGYAFNTIGDSGTMGDFYGAVGMGVNLQQTRTASSYIILSMAYQYFSESNLAKIDFDTHYIFYAKLVVGVNF